jgi:hypothetical protein
MTATLGLSPYHRPFSPASVIVTGRRRDAQPLGAAREDLLSTGFSLLYALKSLLSIVISLIA